MADLLRQAANPGISDRRLVVVERIGHIEDHEQIEHREGKSLALL